MNKNIFLVLTLVLLTCLFLSISEVSAYDYPQLPGYMKQPIVTQPPLDQELFTKADVFTGAFVSNYPIRLPPGTNGLAPSLSLDYNSHRAKQSLPTITGSGWILSQNYIQRKINYTIGDTSDDKFILIMENVSYDLIYNSEDNKYHTEVESYLDVLNKSAGNNTLGQYWVVRDKNGKTYRFGYQGYSEALSNSNSYVWRWSLDLVTDTYGNEIYYSYVEDPYSSDVGTVYPSSIEYNADKDRQVIFSYESSDRPDKRYVSNEGSFVEYGRRLIGISVFADGSLTRRYDITYNSTIVDTRSFISSIAEYGSDNSTSYPTTYFDYNLGTSGFTDASSSWYSDDAFFHVGYTNGGYDPGVRLGDINGDGRVDILKSYCGFNPSCSPSTQDVYINEGSDWYSNSNWDIPSVTFAISSGRDAGTRVVDLNGDDFVDIIQLYQGSSYGEANISRVWLNNGTGFVDYTATWNFPENAFFHKGTTNGGINLGLRFIELNGDGLVDLVKSTCTYPEGGSCKTAAWLNNGNGWESVNWSLPDNVPFWITGFSCVDPGVGITDFNGDGLQDIVQLYKDGDSDPSYQSIWLNNGTGFVNYTSSWNIPSDAFLRRGYTNCGWDPGVRLMDLNGDGLIDLTKSYCNDAPDNCDSGSVDKAVWINRGDGWYEDGNFSLPPDTPFRVALSRDGGTRIADVDGDSVADVVQLWDGTSDPDVKHVYLNDAGKDHLLVSVSVRTGGETTTDYKKSTSLNNEGNDSISDLGFNLWVVSTIQEDNGMTGEHAVDSVKTYDYAGGLFDLGRREFAGFNYSEEMFNDQVLKKYFFYQDFPRRGLKYATEVFDNQDAIYGKTLEKWNYIKNGSYYIAELGSVSDLSYDGDFSNPKNRTVFYEYDSFGNILVVQDFGDADFSGDEKYEKYDYVYNISAWIVNKPKNHTLVDSTGTGKFKNSYYRYDGKSWGSTPLHGSLTQKEDWISGSTYAISKYGYDAYGNIVNMTDANGNTIKYVYGITDSTNTFVERVIDPLGHLLDYRYDLGTGNLISETDANGFVKEHVYDYLGRKIKDILPYDSIAYPTVEYEYETNGIAPEGIIVRKREQNGSSATLDEYQFYDGFGRYIQTKDEFPNSEQIVTNYYYDVLGRVNKQSNPYFVSFSSSYSDPSNVDYLGYTYDPLDRVTNLTNPDGTYKYIDYDHWNITILDENLNQMTYTLNAYDKIINVYEFDNGSVYATTYTYNPVDLLTSVVDSNGNVINYTYDALGRKVKVVDIDSGSWSYGYDKVGNLVNQTDARGILVIFEFDDLNRKISEISPSETIVNVYDSPLNGTLSSTVTDKSIINYTYDNRLRLTNEENKLNGNKFANTYNYDSSDRIISKTLPSGEVLTYTYDSGGFLSDLQNYFGLVYNEKGYPVTINYDSSAVSNYTYNESNFRIERIKTDEKQDIEYDYDNIGNVVFINDSINNKVSSMIYDDLNRLITVNIDSNGGEVVFNFVYNKIGNMLNYTSQTKSSDFYYEGSSPHAPSKVVYY